MSLPFLITPKTIGDFVLCCKLEGGRRTEGVVVRSDIPTPTVEADPWSTNEAISDEEIIEVVFYVCCGINIDIRISWTNPDSGTSYLILLNDVEIFSGAGEAVINKSIPMTSRPCGNKIEIVAQTGIGTATIEVIETN